jgi:hypothetical protein
MEQDGLDPRPLVKRRMIWDIYPHSADQIEIQKRIGLTPDSDDGLDMDHRSSDLRLRVVSPLSDVLYIMSGCASEVVTDMLMQEMLEALREDAEELGGEAEMALDDEYTASFIEQNQEVIFHASLAIIGQLMANGLLAYGERAAQ